MATASSLPLYGLLIKGKEKESRIPLESVSITGHITGYVVGIESSLNYINATDDPLEVMFRFPVDNNWAVVGLEAKIDNRTIKGVVQEKEEAKATYDDAISSGYTAALGEEKTGDIFSLSLGNLPPKAKAQLTLKLVGELSLEGESIRFSLPTVLKPRYTPAGSTDPLAPVTSQGGVERGSTPGVSHFTIQINNTSPDAISSPTHDIVTTPLCDEKDTVSVTLKDSTPLVQDLVLLIKPANPHVPKSTVIEGVEGSNELLSSPVVMLDFFPNFESVRAACEFVFVIDRSGSMSGGYINSAKETLILFLKSIPPGCYFNIIGFGSRYEHLFPTSVSYDQKHLDKAMNHATSLKADLGGTELLNPLQYVFSQPLLPGLPRQVFVLTDGSVSNTSACIDVTKRNANIARVFTFGIGSGASTELVRGLAKAGNGSSEFIKAGDRMQSKVISSLKKALQPSVTNISLTFTLSPQSTNITIDQSPQKIPPIFNGEKIVLYGIIKGGEGPISGTARLTGNILDQVIEHTLDFQVTGIKRSSQGTSCVVHQLAAKSLIKDWEEDDKRKDNVIRLSIQSGVVSKLTAYVAVDEEQDKPIAGALKVWDITATPKESNRSLGFGGGGGRGGRRGMAMAKGMPLTTSALSASSSGMKKRKSTGVKSAAAVPRARSSNKSIDVSRFNDMMDDAMDDEDDDVYEGLEETEEMEAEQTKVKSSSRYKSSPSRPQSSFSSIKTTTTRGNGLQQLIALQSAEGYWCLNESLASVIGKPLAVLKGAIPSGCSDSVWGTVLALVLLETKFSSQQDEWELLVMKAEMWLEGQSLLSSLQSLKKTATDTIN